MASHFKKSRMADVFLDLLQKKVSEYDQEIATITHCRAIDYREEEPYNTYSHMTPERELKQKY